MTSKFEQLIEYVINDEEAKAKELFHDIVVEKSREIYENLMNEEEQDEEDLDESEEDDSEELDENIGGDASDDLIDSIESEEEGMHEDEESDAEYDDEEGEDLTHDIEDAHDSKNLEDRVINLEDQLDELMAEFESIMDTENTEHNGIESDLDGEEGEELEGDALAQDDTQAFADESMMENISLAAAPKPETTEPSFVNTKSSYAVDSGKAGMEGAPVKMTGDVAKGRPAPTAGKASSDKFQNEPATGSKKLSPAPKPVTSQAAGVNTKTPFPKG